MGVNAQICIMSCLSATISQSLLYTLSLCLPEATDVIHGLVASPHINQVQHKPPKYRAVTSCLHSTNIKGATCWLLKATQCITKQRSDQVSETLECDTPTWVDELADTLTDKCSSWARATPTSCAPRKDTAVQPDAPCKHRARHDYHTVQRSTTAALGDGAVATPRQGCNVTAGTYVTSPYVFSQADGKS